MAVIVETGSGENPAANSYVSESDLTAYAAARGKTIAGDKSVMLIQAMDEIEARSYKGERSNLAQPLSWPRIGVYVDGIEIADDAIPKQIKNAQCEAAILIDSGVNFGESTSGGMSRLKVDVVDIEYAPSKSIQYYKSVENQLRPLLTGGGAGSASFQVTR